MGYRLSSEEELIRVFGLAADGFESKPSASASREV
jgi:hypothetical protein